MKLSTAWATGCFRRFVTNFFGVLRQILSAFCGSVRQRFFCQKWQDKSAERALHSAICARTLRKNTVLCRKITMKPWYTTVMACAECVPRNEPGKELYMKRTRTAQSPVLTSFSLNDSDTIFLMFPFSPFLSPIRYQPCATVSESNHYTGS